MHPEQPDKIDAPPNLRLYLVILFLMAVSIRILSLILSLNQIGPDGLMNATPDGQLYVNMAESLINGSNEYEYGFFLFGPGFAYLLSAFFWIFGKSLFPYMAIQILISGLSCLLIYRLCLYLTASYRASIIAAILAALSYTSITLSIVILSDTLYFFVFLISLIFLFRGLIELRWRYFVLCGIFSGIAALIRSIGQFWPIMILLLGFAYYRLGPDSPKAPKRNRPILLRLSTAAIIAFAIMSLWVIRNYHVHGVPTLAYTSAGGAANVAILSLEKIENRPGNEIRREWITDYTGNPDSTNISLGESFRVEIANARNTFEKYPGAMISQYFTLIWRNLNATSFYHKLLFSDFVFPAKINSGIKRLDLNYLNFWLSITGIILLFVKKKYGAAFLLGGVYLYYALMIGFTRWQGSRLFFPGQIAWSILISIVLVHLYDLRKKIYKLRKNH